MMNMEQIPETKKETTMGEAQAYLMGKLAEMHMTGNMDSESDAIKGLQAELQAGTITPAKAMETIDTMISQRQSYH